MTDGDSPHIPRLDDNNWASWSMKIEAHLVRKKLWDMIEVTIPKKKSDGTEKTEEELKIETDKAMAGRDSSKMAECRAELILNVESSQLAHMSSSDPSAIWFELESVHRAHGFATALAYRRKFLSAKKNLKQSMRAWIGHIRHLAFEMRHAGITVTEMDMVLTLTMGLPASYDQLIIVFDSTPPGDLTIESVVARLINEETRQDSGRIHGRSGRAEEEEEDKPKKGFKDESLKVSVVTRCFFCRKTGHMRADCKEKKSWDAWKEKKGEEKEEAQAAIADDDDDDDFGF